MKRMIECVVCVAFLLFSVNAMSQWVPKPAVTPKVGTASKVAPAPVTIAPKVLPQGAEKIQESQTPLPQLPRDVNTSHPSSIGGPIPIPITITSQPVDVDNTAKSVGENISIAWQGPPNIVKYDVYYSIDGGADVLIDACNDVSAETSSCMFNILPEMVGYNVRLRVRDYAHFDLVSAGSNSMDISGTIMITAQPVPADDTAKNVGDYISITWIGSFSIVKYDVYYSIDGGADILFDACNDVPAATSSCTFGILPAMVGNNVRLKVKDYDPAHPVSVSVGSNSMDISG